MLQVMCANGKGIEQTSKMIPKIHNKIDEKSDAEYRLENVMQK